MLPGQSCDRDTVTSNRHVQGQNRRVEKFVPGTSENRFVLRPRRMVRVCGAFGGSGFGVRNPNLQTQPEPPNEIRTSKPKSPKQTRASKKFRGLDLGFRGGGDLGQAEADGRHVDRVSWEPPTPHTLHSTERLCSCLRDVWGCGARVSGVGCQV